MIGSGGGAAPTGPLPGAGPAPLNADLRAALRTRAERIPLRALERRGFRNVQVLDMSTIERIVGEAVTHLLERHTAILTSEERTQIEAEARREFTKLLLEHKKVVAEKSDGEQRREELDRQVQGLRAELDRTQKNLSTERGRDLAASSFSISPEGFKEMEDKIRHLFDHLVSKERRISLAEAGPKALAGLSELEREVAAFLDRLLVGERDRYLGSVRKGHSENIGVLEKRIAKLNRALADTESALRKVAEAKAGDPGIASIYDSIQGLSSLDAFFAKKKELLEIIFKENLTLRRTNLGAARAAGKVNWATGGATAVAPRPSPQSLGFEPPLESVTEETAF